MAAEDLTSMYQDARRSSNPGLCIIAYRISNDFRFGLPGSPVLPVGIRPWLPLPLWRGVFLRLRLSNGVNQNQVEFKSSCSINVLFLNEIKG